MVIDKVVAKNRDLWKFELSNDDWSAISLVAHWLKSFCLATTQMSATKTPMLSTTHAIFHGLQEDIRTSIHSLPDGTPDCLKNSLVNAHRKLSDYYTKFDESPFYLWSSCESILSSVLNIY